MQFISIELRIRQYIRASAPLFVPAQSCVDIQGLAEDSWSWQMIVIGLDVEQSELDVKTNFYLLQPVILLKQI